MFEQFGQNLYKDFAYRVEEIEKGKLYIARRKNGAQIQKWCKTEFMVEMKGDNEEFDCECGLYNHMGILCGHALKVLVLFNFFVIAYGVVKLGSNLENMTRGFLTSLFRR
jgi:hypothetical protein